MAVPAPDSLRLDDRAARSDRCDSRAACAGADPADRNAAAAASVFSFYYGAGCRWAGAMVAVHRADRWLRQRPAFVGLCAARHADNPGQWHTVLSRATAATLDLAARAADAAGAAADVSEL